MTATNIAQEDYDILKANVKQLELELEDKNQQIYDCKKQLALGGALEGDYLQEIETLQTVKASRVEKLQKQIKQLEERTIGLRDAFNPQLLKQADLIETLRNQLLELERTAANNVLSKDDSTNADIEETQLIKEELSMLTYKLVDIQISIDSLQKRNIELEETKNNSYSDLENANQNLVHKIQEVKETKNRMVSLQEDIFLTKLDLDSLKSKPLDLAQQGNSLFGEVEDSRIKMEQNIQQTKKNYTEMKRNVHAKLKKITVLRKENFGLIRQLNAMEDCDEEYDERVAKYEIQVSSLESTVNKYIEEILKDQKLSGEDLPHYAVEFANNTLRSKWKDIEKAGENLNRVSKEKLEIFKEIKGNNSTARNLRRRAQQLKSKIEELESSILELQLQKSPTGIKEHKFPDVETIVEKDQKSMQVEFPEHAKRESNESKAILNSQPKTIPVIAETGRHLEITNQSESFDLATTTKNQKEISWNLENESFFSSTTTTEILKPAGVESLVRKIPPNSVASVQKTRGVKFELNTDNNENSVEIIESPKSNESSVWYPEESTTESALLYVNNAGHTPAVNRQRIMTNTVSCNENVQSSNQSNFFYRNDRGPTNIQIQNPQTNKLPSENLKNCSNIDDSLLSISSSMHTLSINDEQSMNDEQDVDNCTLINNMLLTTIYEESYDNEHSVTMADQEYTLTNLVYRNYAGHTPAPNRKQIIDYYTLTTPECSTRNFPESDNNEVHSNDVTLTENHEQGLDDIINRPTVNFEPRRSRQQAEDEGSFLPYIDSNSSSLGDDEVNSISSTEEIYIKHEDTNEKQVSVVNALSFKPSRDENLDEKENFPLLQHTSINNASSGFINRMAEMKINEDFHKVEQRVTSYKRTNIPVLTEKNN